VCRVDDHCVGSSDTSEEMGWDGYEGGAMV